MDADLELKQQILRKVENLYERDLDGQMGGMALAGCLYEFTRASGSLDFQELIIRLLNLHETEPEDDQIRELLAKSLATYLYYIYGEQRTTYLEKLKVLKRNWPDDSYWQDITNYFASKEDKSWKFPADFFVDK